jgi:hypothetical protein
MKRLILWNIILAACASAGIYELRRQWAETRGQEEAVILRKAKAPKVDAPIPPVKPAPFQAVVYNEVAQKTLFSKDRNPDLPPPAAPPAPPPPPPMPALPHLYGVLGLPSGAVAIMSDRAGGAQQKVRVGGMIGEFKLAKLDTQRITLEWHDKTVEKSIDELLDHSVPVEAAPGVAAAAPPPAAAPSGPPKLGIEIGPAGHSVRACLQTDGSPAGTVLDGYKKTIENTPFGAACRWQQQ